MLDGVSPPSRQLSTRSPPFPRRTLLLSLLLLLLLLLLLRARLGEARESSCCASLESELRGEASAGAGTQRPRAFSTSFPRRLREDKASIAQAEFYGVRGSPFLGQPSPGGVRSLLAAMNALLGNSLGAFARRSSRRGSAGKRVRRIPPAVSTQRGIVLLFALWLLGVVDGNEVRHLQVHSARQDSASKALRQELSSRLERKKFATDAARAALQKRRCLAASKRRRLTGKREREPSVCVENARLGILRAEAVSLRRQVGGPGLRGASKNPALGREDARRTGAKRPRC